MVASESAPIRRRRRLTDDRRAHILGCAADVVAERGYAAVTMDQIADSAVTSKATLYRHWSSKAQLVAEAARTASTLDTSSIDTGSLRGDLHALAAALAQSGTRNLRLVFATSHARLYDEELRKALQPKVLVDLHGLTVMLDRARQRREVRPRATIEALASLLVGGVLTPSIIGEPLSGLTVEELVRYMDDVVLPALCAQQSATLHAAG